MTAEVLPRIDGRQGELMEACKLVENPDVMFPDEKLPNNHPEVREAKAVCAACKFRLGCLRGALERREKYGVWGGMTYKEREALRRRRYRRASQPEMLEVVV